MALKSPAQLGDECLHHGDAMAITRIPYQAAEALRLGGAALGPCETAPVWDLPQKAKKRAF